MIVVISAYLYDGEGQGAVSRPSCCLRGAPFCLQVLKPKESACLSGITSLLRVPLTLVASLSDERRVAPTDGQTLSAQAGWATFVRFWSDVWRWAQDLWTTNIQDGGNCAIKPQRAFFKRYDIIIFKMYLHLLMAKQSQWLIIIV